MGVRLEFQDLTDLIRSNSFTELYWVSTEFRGGGAASTNLDGLPLVKDWVFVRRADVGGRRGRYVRVDRDPGQLHHRRRLVTGRRCLGRPFFRLSIQTRNSVPSPATSL